MNTTDVITYFDSLAPGWDADMICRDDIVERILDNAGVKAGAKVLDVACGTGVLFPYYLRRGVDSVTGVDISPEMARIAAEKFAGCPQISVECGDIESAEPGRRFDVVMVYNAFPHFPDAKRLIDKLSSLTKAGGRLSIAHGMSREHINEHHKGSASKVSRGLMEAEKLSALFGSELEVDVVISDDDMYQVSGIRRG